VNVRTDGWMHAKTIYYDNCNFIASMFRGDMGTGILDISIGNV